jgi:hypothetical protein
MAKEVLEMEVKSNIGEVAKDTEKLSNEASNAAGEFTVMGVSLNGVKKAFASAAVTAKGMFGTIKAGLISSGIGIFLIAIGSLVQYFKDSEEGASKLKQITSALGVIFGNFTDIISNLGKLLFETFSNPKKAVSDLWEAIKTNLMNRVEGLVDVFKAVGKIIQSTFTLDWEGVKEGMLDYGESLAQVATGVDDVFNKTKNGINNVIDAAKELSAATKKEIAQAIKLEKDRLALQIFEREAIVEKARTEKDMMELRLKARDFETFAAEERLVFMREANVLAAEQLEKDLFVAKEKLRFQVEENSYSKSTQQNLDDEAALQAAVFDLEKNNFSERKRLKSEEQAIVKEIAANNKQIAANTQKTVDAEKKQIQELIDLEQDRLDKLIVDGAALLDQFNESQLEAQDKEMNAIYDKYFAIIQGKIALGESVVELEENQQAELFAITEKYRIKGVDAEGVSTNKKKALAKSKLDFELGMANQGLQAIASAAGEGTAIAKAAAIAQATISGVQGVQNAFTSANANIGATAGSFGVYPVTMAALAGTFAAMNIAKIASGGGGGVTPPSTPPPSVQTPAPQMMSGAFDISGGVAPEAMKAYVVTDEMSNSQNQLANIRRRATI